MLRNHVLHFSVQFEVGYSEVHIGSIQDNGKTFKVCFEQHALRNIQSFLETFPNVVHPTNFTLRLGDFISASEPHNRTHTSPDRPGDEDSWKPLNLVQFQAHGTKRTSRRRQLTPVLCASGVPEFRHPRGSSGTTGWSHNKLRCSTSRNRPSSNCLLFAGRRRMPATYLNVSPRNMLVYEERRLSNGIESNSI